MALRLARENPATMNVLCSTLRSAKSQKSALRDFSAGTIDSESPESIGELVGAFFELPITDPSDEVTSSGRLHALRLVAKNQCTGAKTPKTV